MSYVLHVWQHPTDLSLPTTFAEALRCIELVEQRKSPCPALAVLATSLTSRFPCICSAEAKRIPEHEWAWSDGPLDGLSDSAVYGIGLNSGRVHDVLRILIPTARALGLNVLDEQAGICFLRDGAVYHTAAKAAPVVPAQVDAESVLEIVDARFSQLMEGHQFEVDTSVAPLLSGTLAGRRYRQTFPGGQHVFEAFVEQKAPAHFELSARFETRIDAISEMLVKIGQTGPQAERTGRWCTTALHSSAWIGDYGTTRDGIYTLRDQKEFDLGARLLVQETKAFIMPHLAFYQRIDTLDTLLNVTARTRWIYRQPPYACGAPNLIAAYLAGNPNLDQLCGEYLAMAEAEGIHAASADGELLRKCINFVRQQSQPGTPGAN